MPFLLPQIVTVFLCAVSAQEEVENPEYKRWASFKPGAWVRVKSVSRSSDGGKPYEVQFTYKLVKVTKTRVILEWKSLAGKISKRDIPAKIRKIDTGKIKEGNEELVVAGTKLKCRWYNYGVTLAGKKYRNESWVSDRVPGGMVKETYSRVISAFGGSGMRKPIYTILTTKSTVTAWSTRPETPTQDESKDPKK